MGDTALMYRKKLVSALEEAGRHLGRLELAFSKIGESFVFPLSGRDFHALVGSDVQLAFADQIIYRFSKAQDCMGAKLFKAFLLYQGENVDRPFLDILTALEKIDVLNVDMWFELREIRNEISHEYEESEERGRAVLNGIYAYKGELRRILAALEGALSSSGGSVGSGREAVKEFHAEVAEGRE